MRKLIFLMLLAFTLTATAQHKIYGDLEVYGTIKGQGIGAQSSGDTVIVFNSTDSLFYKVAASDLSIASNAYSPWLTLYDGQGGMLVNNTDSADRVYIRHYSGFDPESPNTTNAFIGFNPYEAAIDMYSDPGYNGGASVRMVDLSVRDNYTDNLYIGRNSESTVTRENYITARRNNNLVFALDTVGNISMYGVLRLGDSWKTTVTPKPGDIYFDNSDSTLRVYTGTQWETVNTTP